MQHKAAEKLEKISGRLFNLDKSKRNIERMLVDRKFDLPEIRKVVYTMEEILRRTNMAFTSLKELDKYSDFFKQLVEQIGHYATHASEDLAYVHQIIKPENLERQLTWYIKHIGTKFGEGQNEFIALSEGQALFQQYVQAAIFLTEIDVMSRSVMDGYESTGMKIAYQSLHDNINEY